MWGRSAVCWCCNELLRPRTPAGSICSIPNHVCTAPAGLACRDVLGAGCRVWCGREQHPCLEPPGDTTSHQGCDLSRTAGFEVDVPHLRHVVCTRRHDPCAVRAKSRCEHRTLM